MELGVGREAVKGVIHMRKVRTENGLGSPKACEGGVLG